MATNRGILGAFQALEKAGRTLKDGLGVDSQPQVMGVVEEWARAFDGVPDGVLVAAVGSWLSAGGPSLDGKKTQPPSFPVPRLISPYIPRDHKVHPSQVDPAAWRGPVGCPMTAQQWLGAERLYLQAQATLEDQEAARGHRLMAEKTQYMCKVMGYHPRWPSPSEVNSGRE